MMMETVSVCLRVNSPTAEDLSQGGAFRKISETIDKVEDEFVEWIMREQPVTVVERRKRPSISTTVEVQSSREMVARLLSEAYRPIFVEAAERPIDWHNF